MASSGSICASFRAGSPLPSPHQGPPLTYLWVGPPLSLPRDPKRCPHLMPPGEGSDAPLIFGCGGSRPLLLPAPPSAPPVQNQGAPIQKGQPSPGRFPFRGRAGLASLHDSLSGVAPRSCPFFFSLLLPVLLPREPRALAGASRGCRPGSSGMSWYHQPACPLRPPAAP